MSLTQPRAGQRHLALPGSYNIRDLGGYPTLGGASTRWRALLRADSLHGLDTAAQAALLDYGVASIIDLRRPEECERQPNVFAASALVRYSALSLLPTSAAGTPEHIADLATLYRYLLDNAQGQLRAVLTAVAQAPKGVLVHCTAGKDRTGVVVALLLALVGVPDDIIIEDYALTGVYIAPLLEQLRAAAAQAGYASAQFEPLLESRPEAMAAMLAHLGERYGGAEGYAATIGLGPAELAGIRTHLVE